MAYYNGQQIAGIRANVTTINLPIDQTYSPESENAQSGKAVAEALANVDGGDTFATIAEITLEEAVNAITIDENTFPDIAKVKDFYIAFSIGKTETEQSGHLYISSTMKSGSYILGRITTWNHTNYVTKGSFYSRCFDDYFRFNSASTSFNANGASSVTLATTSSQMKEPLQNIIVKCSTADSLIPVDSKFIIKGYVGK